MCSATNEIDFSDLESREAIMARLADMGIALHHSEVHHSEVHGPVMDRLVKTHLMQLLAGPVFSPDKAFHAVKDGSIQRFEAAQ